MRWILALVALAGCTSAEEPECGRLEPGGYRVDFLEVSGDCGGSMQQVVVVQADGTVRNPPECTGGETVLDECTVAVDKTCQIVSETTGEALGTSHFDGVITRRRTSATGTIEAVGTFAGGDSCRAVYELTYTRL
jgi:hypothetical protein